MEKAPRESIQAPVLRHGETEFSAAIAKGEKPSYESYVAFMRGEIDPPINEEETAKSIHNHIESGAIRPGRFNLVICSPSLRAVQTAELARKALNIGKNVHQTKYLDEVRMPMTTITPEFYAEAQDMSEIRARFMDEFLKGAKINEDVVDSFRRAERFLEYFRRIKSKTAVRPLFITHGIFSRILNLVVQHEGETLSDSEVRQLVAQEFHQTKVPNVLGGFEIINAENNRTKIAGVL